MILTVIKSLRRSKKFGMSLRKKSIKVVIRGYKSVINS